MLQRGFCLLILICAFLLIAPAIEAATCQNIAGEQVCILRIKRSAKYYWQYRVTLNIDGKRQPKRFYNCRDRYYQEPDTIKVYYDRDDKLGKSICRLYK